MKTGRISAVGASVRPKGKSPQDARLGAERTVTRRPPAAAAIPDGGAGASGGRERSGPDAAPLDLLPLRPCPPREFGQR